jgi:signal transduction histidine kinase/ligand-binding sensor domain-containing protein
LLASCRGAFALDPSLDISQYAHTAWKIREGAFKGSIQAIAQTPDGYLWLGTEFGLLRFDGQKNVPWQPPTGEHLPSSTIAGLLATRDGTLWIGTLQGLASWKDGKLSLYPELAGQQVIALLEDREGEIWAGSVGVPAGRLCEIHREVVRCHGEDDSLGRGVLTLYEDGQGNLWAGAQTGLWRWKPGRPKLYPMPEAIPGITSLIVGDDGALLISMRDGIRRFLDGKAEMVRLTPASPRFKPRRLFRDRNGGLWIATFDRGLVHVHLGRLDVFAQADGLSDDDVLSLFEDREGNIWVATVNGLDRFREFAVPPISFKQGLSSASVWSVLSVNDGGVWLGTSDGVNRLNNGQTTIYRKRRDLLPSRPPEQSVARNVTDSELPDDVESLFQDDRGRIWVFAFRGTAYFEKGRFTPVSSLPGGYVRSVDGDRSGNLWISNQDRGLFHLNRGNLVERIPWATLGRTDFADALSVDPAQGGVWLGLYQGGVAYFRDGQIRASYNVADGLGKGRVGDVQVDMDGALWAATEGGLSRVKDGRISTLNSRNGLPCDSVHWAREDKDRSYWLDMACGLVRIERTQMDAWVIDPQRKIQTTVFDSSDGVRSRAFIPFGFSPRVARTADGKLWFLPGDGVSVIDPRHLPFNKLPPPVHIEQITADGKIYWQNMTGDASSSHLTLPPLVRDLTIDYTALSLAVPEKVRFRFKLEGQDRDWREVVNDRAVEYSNLAPGNYRFRVTACNNSGVWNEQGASLGFSIAPAYWQTRWFVALCVAAFMALLWALYQLRLRQLAREFSMTLDARVGERTRIARELHDTLLQSFHGLLLRFQAAYELLPARPAEAKQSLERAIDQAAQAITEGRDAVQGLRGSVVESNDLAVAIRTFGDELAAEQAGDGSAVLHVVVEGTPRTLHPIQRDEIYRIACEALRNAFKHASATQIEVELRYDERQLRLRVRDDGKGIDPRFLIEEGRAGHYGLHGMRERAKLMGGKLTVWSGPDSGAEVELIIPAARAYAASASTWRSWFVKIFSRESVQSEP